DRRGRLPRDPRPWAGHRPGDPSPLPSAHGDAPRSRDRAPRGRSPGRRDRVPLGVAARRVDLRDHRRSGALPQPVARVRGDTKAVFFAFDDEEAERMKREWEELEMAVPLVIEEAPFRDVGDPLLAHLRRITEDPNAVAVAIMPELIFSGAARLLHNQRALYI